MKRWSHAILFFWVGLFLACDGVHVRVPKGAQVTLLSWETRAGDQQRYEMKRGREGHIYNEYLDRFYLGGDTYQCCDATYEGDQFEFLLAGRLGGKIHKTIVAKKLSPDWPYPKALLFPPEKIIGGDGFGAELVPPDLAPEEFALQPERGSLLVEAALPVTCPRLASTRRLLGLASDLPAEVVSDPTQDYYDACLDRKYHPQLEEIQPPELAPQFDDQNVLCIEQATMTFDWEDARLVGGTERDETGRWRDIYEIGGGLYSNIHFAAMPCHAEYQRQYQKFLDGLPKNNTTGLEAARLMRCANDPQCRPATKSALNKYGAYRAMQFFLHLGNNRLEEIGRTDVQPPVRTHVPIPGPFLAKTGRVNNGYDQCEWFDTRHHAPRQSVNYRNLCIWDWDLSQDQCVMIVLWEGDGGGEERRGGPRALGHIGPTDLTDDFVGVMEVQKADADAGIVTLRNYSGEFVLEVRNHTSVVCP